MRGYLINPLLFLAWWNAEHYGKVFELQEWPWDWVGCLSFPKSGSGKQKTAKQMFPDKSRGYICILQWHLALCMSGLDLFWSKNTVVAGKQETSQIFLLNLLEFLHVLLCAMDVQLYILILLLFLQTTLTWGPYLWFHMLRVATSTLSGIALFHSWVNW